MSNIDCLLDADPGLLALSLSGKLTTIDRFINVSNGLVGGGNIRDNDIFIQGVTPGTLSVSSTNDVNSHTHEITTSNNPGATSAILATDSSGYLEVVGITGSSYVDGGSLSISGISELSGNVELGADIGTDNHVLYTTGWNVTHDGVADFRSVNADDIVAGSVSTDVLTVDTLVVSTFIPDNVLATAGTEIITKSLAILAEDFIVAASVNIVVHDLPGAPEVPVFSNGDTVSIRRFDSSGGGLEVEDIIGTVSSYVNLADQKQQWTLTKISGTNSETVYAGTTVLDYGVSGDSFILTTVTDTYSPYTDVRVWDSSIDNDTTLVRLGNLEGMTAQTEYGIFFGEISSNKYGVFSDQRIDIHGADLTLYDTGTPTFKIDSSVPSLAMGNPLPTYSTGSGVWAGYDSGYYKFRVGNASDYMLWDGTMLTVAGKMLMDGDSEFIGVLSIGSSGGIYQGTGTFASPDTGLKIWNDSGIGSIQVYESGNIGVTITDDGVILSSQEVTDPITDTNQYNEAAPDGVSSLQFRHTDQTIVGGFIQSYHPDFSFEQGWMGAPTDPAYDEETVRLDIGTGADLGETYISLQRVLALSGPGAYTFGRDNQIEYVSDYHIFTGEVSTSSTLKVTGDITAYSDLAVYGDAAISGGLMVGGPLTGVVDEEIRLDSGGSTRFQVSYDGTWCRLNSDVSTDFYTPRLFRSDGGLAAGYIIPGANNVGYTGNLVARRSAVDYTAYAIVPLTSPSTQLFNWSSSTSQYITMPNIPSNAKWVACRIIVAVSGSAFRIRPLAGVTASFATNISVDVNFTSPTDGSNRLYFDIGGSVSNLQLIVTAYAI